MKAGRAQVAIFAQPLDLRRQRIGREAAFEQAHGMPGRKQRLGDVPDDAQRATEDHNPRGAFCGAVAPSRRAP